LGGVVRFNLPEAALDIDTPADAARLGIEVVPLPLYNEQSYPPSICR
jgi:hypothetical protein